jgi:hypothetical protein
MPTTNNNWPTPVATDLVKDGWEAIKDLGDAIDTTLGVYADPGLVLLNTTSFSGVASQSINSVFSSTYDNYRILCFLTPSSAVTTTQLRLRLSGTDSTASSYSRQQLRAYGTTVATTSATETGWQFGASFNNEDDADAKVIAVDMFRPALAVNTKYLFQHFQGTADQELNYVGGVHTVATAYDGFTIFALAGNITGTVSVYGYNK